MDFWKEWKERLLVKQLSNKEKIETAFKQKAGVYCGFDPTGPSLHIGHLAQILMLKRLKLMGLKPIILIGSGTAMIGDPNGKNSERPLLEIKDLQYNTKKIKQQLKKFIGEDILFLNNGDWWEKMSVTEYLRLVGRDFNLNYMLDKEIINTRLKTGISYTEFSYMTLQAYDFWYLYKNHNCYMQIGGSDQWGNISAGIEFIRKKESDKHNACALTLELLTKEDGTKFGKSENNAIWLDPNLTSAYELYQFFINQSDEVLKRLFSALTLLSNEEIRKILKRHQENPSVRYGQKKLAEYVTQLIHDSEKLEMAINITDSLFSGDFHKLSLEQLMETKNNLLWFKQTEDILLIELLIKIKVCDSKRQARELITNSGITVNGVIIADEKFIISSKNSLFSGKITLIQKGKKNFYIINH